MKIQQIRNATIKINYGELTLLIDPWLEDKGTGMMARCIIPEMMNVKSPLNDLPFSTDKILENVDYCLVTHIHPDHFTKDYLPLDLQLILQNKKDEDTAKSMGFSNTKYFETNELKIKDVTITKVCGIHGNTPELVEQMGTVSGFILQHPNEKTLYIAGDTIFYDGVENNIKTYNPDVIVLNCCEATNPYGRLLMNKDDIVSVCKTAPQSQVIASHLDSVNHALITREDVREFVLQNNLSQVSVPRDGEVLEF